MKVRGWSWATSWPVVALWAIVAVGVAMSSLVALFTPAWYVRPHALSVDDPVRSFGVWTWCAGEGVTKQCAPVGEGVEKIPRASPSVVWVIVGAVYGGGGVLLAVTGLVSLLTPLFPSTTTRSAFAHIASNIQAAAVSLQAVGLVLYPLGLGSSFAREQCGAATTIYSAGECQLGYAYMLALVSTALAAYCPVLARLVTYKDYSNYWSNLNFL